MSQPPDVGTGAHRRQLRVRRDATTPPGIRSRARSWRKPGARYRFSTHARLAQRQARPGRERKEQRRKRQRDYADTIKGESGPDRHGARYARIRQALQFRTIPGAPGVVRLNAPERVDYAT